MSITLPNHEFSYWSDPEKNDSPPALIVGAGFSAPQVSLPAKLATQYAKRQHEIEKTLDIATGFEFEPDEDGGCIPDELYFWADKCIDELKDFKGYQAHIAKQKFIEAIGLLEDQEFAATSNVPLRGTTPRHRVLARLAREGCIHSLWSLNWDLWLEAAFEAVGLIRKNSEDLNSSDALPDKWKKSYQVFLPSDTRRQKNSCIQLFKPHGCIRAFAEGSNNTFQITRTELETKVDSAIKQDLKDQVVGKPVCTLGWGATEINLQEIFRECAEDNRLQKGSLTIVSLSWNDDFQTIDSRHSGLAKNFSQTQSETLCVVKKNSPGTTDDLMQWIQTLRSLRRLKAVVNGLAPSKTILLQQIEQQIDVYKSPVFFGDSYGWALSWFDNFLPVWSRVCFSVKAIEFRRDAVIPLSAIPMTRRDEHIPLNDSGVARWDILSAAHLYCTLLSINQGEMSEFDFENFPGAFFHRETRCLLIPVPMWVDVGDISLAAIKPLMESRHWSDMGRVKGVCLLRISRGADQPVAEDGGSIAVWKRGIASVMKLSVFAVPEKIDDCHVHDLSTYLQNKKDAV